MEENRWERYQPLQLLVVKGDQELPILPIEERERERGGGAGFLFSERCEVLQTQPEAAIELQEVKIRWKMARRQEEIDREKLQLSSKKPHALRVSHW